MLSLMASGIDLQLSLWVTYTQEITIYLTPQMNDSHFISLT